jgi:hypothetical protein
MAIILVGIIARTKAFMGDAVKTPEGKRIKINSIDYDL